MPYSFTASAVESRSYTGVGISRDAKLYVYGLTPDSPGEIQPAVLGVPRRVELRAMATASEYGKRTYLLLFLDSPSNDPDGNLVLRVPIGYTKPNGVFQLSGPTRSLLAAMLRWQPEWYAAKLFAVRGSRANFIDLIPTDSELNLLDQVRVTLIPPTREAADDAVNRINQLLSASAAHV